MRRDLMLEWARQHFQNQGEHGKSGLAQEALEGDAEAWDIFFLDVAPDLEVAKGGYMGELIPGNKFLFLTATNYYLGEVEKANAFEVVLKNPNFICYIVGEVNHSLRTGEIEDYDYAPARNHILLAALANYWDWHHPLPALARGPSGH